MPLPLIAAAIAAGGIRALVGVSGAKKEAKRKRRLIEEAYGIGRERLGVHQKDVRQSQIESLIARGLYQNGEASEVGNVERREIAAPEPESAGQRALQRTGHAPKPEPTIEYTVPGGREPKLRRGGPSTLGAQQRYDTEKEFGLEQKDLDAQQRAALSDVDAQRSSGITDAIVGGISTGFNVYGAGKDLSASHATARAASGDYGTSVYGSGGMLSPIHQAMSGVEDASNWFGGINGLDPLGAEGSSWNRKPGTVVGAGQPNFDFRVG